MTVASSRLSVSGTFLPCISRAEEKCGNSRHRERPIPCVFWSRRPSRPSNGEVFDIKSHCLSLSWLIDARIASTILLLTVCMRKVEEVVLCFQRLSLQITCPLCASIGYLFDRSASFDWIGTVFRSTVVIVANDFLSSWSSQSLTSVSDLSCRISCLSSSGAVSNEGMFRSNGGVCIFC